MVPSDRTLTLVYGGGRVALGVAAMSVPELAARVVSGREQASGIEPLFARMLGARDLALGLGTLVAVRRAAPVRGWLEVSAVVDLADAVSGVLARKQISAQSLAGTVVLATGSAVVGAVLARRSESAAFRQ
jgi:hypothetical protein